MAEFIPSQVAYSTHPHSVYMKSTLILSSHLRLGIQRDIILGLSRQVMCLTTHATRSSYVIYFEHKTKFYERQVTQIFFVFMPFCDISELYASSSVYFQAPFDCAEGPLSRQCRATRTASGIWQA